VWCGLFTNHLFVPTVPWVRPFGVGVCGCGVERFSHGLLTVLARFWWHGLGFGQSDFGCHMTNYSKSKSFSRTSAGVLLLVGVLAGVAVGGGVGVIAASSTKTVTVCANKKTNVLR
jgi:hypothetical protein